MAANNFYDIADTAGVVVASHPLPVTRSVSVELGGRCYIGIDTSPMPEAEEAARLGHELGHCLYGGFYSRHTACDMIERHERRADAWYIKQAIPRDRLFELLRQGYDAWEIAEMLCTTEDYVRRAYYYYRETVG